MFSKLINYIKDTRNELKHVNWPTKKQTTNFTILVIAVSLAVAFFMGFFDVVFTYLLKNFVL
jgi:preprotein translocase subunit SecE